MRRSLTARNMFAYIRLGQGANIFAYFININNMIGYTKKKIVLVGCALLLTVGLSVSCASYSLSLAGASIPAEMKTVTVEFFENNAQIVNPILSQNFTEALKDRIRNQSRLSQVSQEGDAIFSGYISGYAIGQAAVGGQNDQAQLNRLTITISVKYVDNINPDNSFEQSFSRYQDFSGDVQTSEATMNTAIINMLTEDIFNKAFANW